MVVDHGRNSISVCARIALVCVLIAICRADAPAQSPAGYSILDLGTLGGNSTSANDIAVFGQAMVGQAQTASGANHAFAQGWYGLKDLGTLGGAKSTAFAVDWNVVLGSAQTASGQEHAFTYDLSRPNGMVDLGTLGGTWSAAYGGLNGLIVGASTTTGDKRVRAFALGYPSATMTPLPFDWGGDSVARGTDGESIVGYACTSGNASCHAFLFRNNAATDLGSLGGNSDAYAVNSSGQVAGTYALADGTTKHAFLYANGALTDLGTLGGANSEAFDIDPGGDIVGTSDTAGGGAHAFLWKAGVMTDLNTLLPTGSGWVLQSATGISDGGQITGTGTLDGATRGFLLTPPTDVMLSEGGQSTQQTSNLPNGVEVGAKNITFVISASGSQNPDPITIYGAKLTDTLSGPAEYVAIRSYRENDFCKISAKTVTCDLGAFDTIGFGPEIWVIVRTTAPGTISHTTTISYPSDSNSANNSVTESNRAVALSDLSLTPSAIAGGKASSARVTLTDIAPYSNDATVRLASSRPDVAPVPATIIVPNFSGSPSRTFNIIPNVVSEPTTVNISATYGQVTVTRTLTVLPPVLQQLYLTPTTIIGGCGTSAGKIALTGAAPTGGAVVPLSNTNGAATAPASVTVPAGSSSVTFTMTTKTVTTPVAGKFTASFGGVSQTLDVTVRPIRAKTVALSPNPATGGATVNGTITLECAAPAGGIVVSLTSSNSTIAAPTVSSVTIPAGATTGSFSIRTTKPAVSTSVSIYATVYGVRKTTTLTVNP
jgi:probable HAF family extracellular repeat protein